MNTREQRWHLFATAQAILAGMVVFGLGLLYKVRPDLTRNSSAAFAVIMVAALVVGYYLSFHQLLKRKLISLSTIVVSILSAANLWLIIWQTGGLDSPYLALWLLYIAALGVLGWLWPLIASGLSVAIYAFSLTANHSHPSYVITRVVQLGLILVAGGVAEFIARRFQTAQPGKVASPGFSSGPLSPDQLETRVLMASMGEGVIVVNSQRQVQLFNRAAQLLTGWDAAAAQNLDYRTVLKLTTGKDQPVADAQDPFVQAWQQNTTVVVNDLIVTTQAGRRYAITMTASPIFASDGKIAGGIALFRDISAEKAIERQRDEFISTASHEMRTPIAAIEGYLALGLNPSTATVDDRAKGYLEKAHESIGHLGELFKNLLMITKLEDKQLGDRVENIDLSKLVKKATDDMQTVAMKKNLTLQLTSGSQLVAEANPIMPVYLVRANPERLREVVMNLIENATKYTQAGRIVVNITGENSSVTVSIADTGPGIPSEDLPHLFQKFYRVDNSATRTIGGTGLGLYICRTVVELYGGQIWAESKPGSGSTFTFRLPRLKNQTVATDLPGGVTNPEVPIMRTTDSQPPPSVTMPPASLPTEQAAPAIAPTNNSLIS